MRLPQMPLGTAWSAARRPGPSMDAPPFTTPAGMAADPLDGDHHQ